MAVDTEWFGDGGMHIDTACYSQTCGSAGYWGPCTGWTPIVLSFDAAPVVLASARGHFDLGQGDLATTDWPSPATPWLALDRNGDGLINDGSELFGSLTRLATGVRARHGFEALAELDSNGDGVIDSHDAAWKSLRLWYDFDGDRAAGLGELVPLTKAGVESIGLRYSANPRCDGRGNCELERAEVILGDARGRRRHGTAVDVHLASRRETLSFR